MGIYNSEQQVADIAQLVEQRIENPCVTSSTLVIGTNMLFKHRGTF